jgi:tripartite-type tricarboxylate transporter receptor subunit TctC
MFARTFGTHAIGILIMRALAAAPALLLPGAAAAQEFPAKTMRIVVPFPPGGATDILAREIATPLNRAFGQSVVIENRAGANTVIGAELVMRAPADGHTMLVIAPSFSINPSVRSKMPYDTLKDFSGVARGVSSPLCITVHPAVPAKNVRELIALARARPGEMTFASASIIGGQRLAGELFFREVAKVDIINVPYNGGAPAATAVIGGHTMILVSNVTEVVRQLGAGRLRGIAVMSLARADQLPDVPTLSESGYPGFEASNWYGIVMRSATPRNVIERLSAEIGKALDLPDVKESLHKFGLVPAYLNAGEFDALIQSELQRYARIVSTLKLRMD